MSKPMADTLPRRPLRRFDEEFKAQAVRLVLDEGKSVGSVALRSRLTEAALREWVNRARLIARRGRPGFVRTIEASSAVLPVLVFEPDVPYNPHVCYSCAEAIPHLWGRCWRCSLAAGWAARQPIPSELLAVHDVARVVV